MLSHNSNPADPAKFHLLPASSSIRSNSSSTTSSSSAASEDAAPPDDPPPHQPPQPPPPSQNAPPSQPNSNFPSSMSSLSTVSPPPSSAAHRIPFFYPHLMNQPSDTDPPRDPPASELPAPVTKHQFHQQMLDFKSKYPPIKSSDQPLPPHFDDVRYIRDFRTLLDKLDRLSEQLPLRHQTTFFDLLSHRPAIDYLLFLLSDISVESNQGSKDIRKLYRYPHLVAAILANGNMVVRDSFIEKPHLVDHLLSFLDGNIPLHSFAPSPAVQSKPDFNHPPTDQLQYARNNQTIVIHVVQILVSYLDTSPDVLLRALQNRLSLFQSLMGLIYIGAIPKMFESFIPDLSVHQVSTTTLAPSLSGRGTLGSSSSSSNSTTKLSFNKSMVYALNALAKVRIFHLLSDTFYKVTLNLHHYLNPQLLAKKSARDRARELYRIKQYTHNLTDVYESLVSKLIRAIRIHASNAASEPAPTTDAVGSEGPNMNANGNASANTNANASETPTIHACDYLNVYSTKDTADTIAKILRCGISLLFKVPKTRTPEQDEVRDTACVILNDGLTMLLRVLRVVQYDYEVRVASVTGPPRPLDTRPLEAALLPLLHELVYILVDTPGGRAAALRIAILDALVELLRIGHSDTIRRIHDVRFGGICLKLIVMHRSNSLVHHVVCRAVEDALISKKSVTADCALHWLVKTDLPRWVMQIWNTLNGSETFQPPSSDKDKERGKDREKERQAAGLQTLLSTVVHFACCIHHFLAMERKRHVDSVLPPDVATLFATFWHDHFAALVKAENDGPLGGGTKPRRKMGFGSSSSSSSSLSSSSSSSSSGSSGSLGSLTGQSSRAAKWSGALRTNYDSYPSEDELRAQLAGADPEQGEQPADRSGAEDGDGREEAETYMRANLVPSDSAHRFGYVEPVNSLSRFDDVFDAAGSGGDDFGQCDSMASLFDGNDGFG